MKKMIYILLFLLLGSSTYASIAVVPYKMETLPGEISGREYARLLSLTILLTRDTDVLSPEEAEIGMKQVGIDPDATVTEEDLHTFGIKYKLDYILIGTITKKKGQYYFDNVYYSVKDREIISRNKNSAGDIYKLALQEVKDTLFNVSKKEQVKQQKQADVAFVIDLSYNIYDDWEAVKNSINTVNSTLVGKYGIDTRIFILPFSDRKDQEYASVHNNSVKGVKEKLEGLNPSGSPDMKKFTSVLNHALRNLKWRSGSVKEIVIITNSNLTDVFMSEKYASEAKKRGIKITVISCGKVTGEFSDIERLPDLTGGSSYSVSYHQTVHDSKGDKHELYLQRGRIFHSLALYRSWRGGVLISKNRNPKYVEVPDSIEEIYLPKPSVVPAKMMQVFSDNMNLKIIDKEIIQNNINDIMGAIQGSFANGSSSANYGKALISDGKISLWVRVTDDKIMQEFQRNDAKEFYTKIGFIVKESKTEAYGVELVPVAAGITSDYIPDRCKATLSGIIKNPDYYSSTGVGFPPVWFVEVKIENTESFEGRKDVRD